MNLWLDEGHEKNEQKEKEVDEKGNEEHVNLGWKSDKKMTKMKN